MEQEMKRKFVAMIASNQISKPYFYLAHGPDKFDCAGLVWYVFHECFNINVYDGGIGNYDVTKIMTSNVGIITLLDEKCENKDISYFKKGDIIKHKEEILEQIRSRKYEPSPVKRVFIPKENGDKRGLGIPTVMDRVIQ